MDRRQFLINIFKVSGFVGLASLGLTTKEMDAFAGWYYGGGAATCDAGQSEIAAQTSSTHAGKYNTRTRLATQFVFTGTTGKVVCQVRLYLSFVGTSTHNYTVSIYSDTGADLPNTALGTSNTYDLSVLGDAAGEATFDFEFTTPTSALTNGTKYWVVLTSVADATDASNHAYWYSNTSGTTNRWADYGTDVNDWTYIAAATYKYVLYVKTP